ncbi:Tat binding protein 1-interacting protein-domain-containing protein [Thermoascus aurantiacus ATCC 26904]
MAPKKGKADKTALEDGAAMILDYLRKQNRPYSAIDISANLHNKVTKSYAAKALKEMHERKQVEGRVSGKQIVYHALQDPADDATPEALAAIEDGIKQLQDELAAHKASEKSLRGELAMLCSKVPISELRQEVSRLEAERAETLGRLAKLRNDDDGALVSAEQRAQVEREWKEWRKHVHVRKKICRDLWERCTEVLPEDTTKEDLWESLGLEGAF